MVKRIRDREGEYGEDMNRTAVDKRYGLALSWLRASASLGGQKREQEQQQGMIKL